MRVLGPRAGVDRRTILTAIVAAAPVFVVRGANGEVKVSQAVVHYEATPRAGRSAKLALISLRRTPANSSVAPSRPGAGANCG